MADNWEDRLAAHPAIKNAKPASNWEDRLHGADYTQPKKITDEGGSLHFGPFDTGIKTSPAVENFLAGTGKAMVDLGRGIGQKFGLVSNADIEAARKLDAQLMDTTAGKIGNFAGSVATAAPLAFIPGANTLAGAAVIGAGSGFLQPSTSGSELAANTGLGAVAGVGGNVAGRVIGATVGGIKAAAQPFFAKGRQALEADLIRRFTPNTPEALRNLATNGAELVPGSLPTAAEAAGNTGIAQLSKQVQQLSPDAKEAFAARVRQQNAARVAAVRSVAGDPGQREFYHASRETAANDLYAKARAAGFDPAALTPEAQQNIAAMQARFPEPLINEAKTLAQITGTPMDDSSSIEGMHWLKSALDGRIAKESGPSGNPQFLRAYSGLKNDFLTGMENLSPAYKDARLTYEAMSKPINQMDVGKALADKLVPALNDFGAHGNLQASNFATALRSGDATAQRVLGMPSATMENVLEPEHISLLHALGKDLARSSDGVTLARAPGSDTAQNIASQNIIKNIMGPLGLPEGLASQTLLRTITRPAQWAASLAEPQILSSLGQTLLSPEATAAALQRAQVPGLTTKLAEALRTYGTPAGILTQQMMMPSVNAPQE